MALVGLLIEIIGAYPGFPWWGGVRGFLTVPCPGGGKY